MRIPRFYQADTLKVNHSLELSPENFRHAIQVMRLKLSSRLILFNGEKGEYLAELSEINKKSASVNIITFDPINRESPLTSKLVLALIKPDKFDFALQKAVELGISSIQPIKTDRSVINIKASRLDKKTKHWEGVIHSACEQSGRTKIPELLSLISLQEYLQTDTFSTRMVMLPTAKQSLKQFISNHQHTEQNQNCQSIDLLIGPEGGYTHHEEELLAEKKISAITFGSRILRAETAVIAGLTALQISWGDLE